MTPNLERPLIESLNRWESHHAGSYPLEKYLGGAGMSAVYSTEYGEDRTPAVIKLMPVDGSEGNRRLTLLSALSKQSHRGLIRLFDAGLCEIEGVSLLYVVMERADADLAQVLPERALTEVEARQMLEAVVGALSFLHEQGFVHGGIQPSNILAVGDGIKLSCDCVSYAGSPADDVRALGVTLVQALTQRKPNPRTPGRLAQPFFDIATHCLKPDPQSRWNIRQIAARLCEPEAPADKNPRRMAVYSMSIAITALAVISIVLMAGRDRSRTQIVAAPPAARSRSNPRSRHRHRQRRRHRRRRGKPARGLWLQRPTPSRRMRKTGRIGWRANGRNSKLKSTLHRFRMRSRITWWSSDRI